VVLPILQLFLCLSPRSLDCQSRDQFHVGALLQFERVLGVEKFPGDVITGTFVATGKRGHNI